MNEDEEFEFRARAEKEKPVTSGEPTLGEKVGAGLYGAATGLGGSLGELEKFGAYTVPETLGLSEPSERGKVYDRETIFPTVKEVESGLGKLGIKKPREEVSGYQTAGEILGGLGTSLPSIVKGGAKALLGGTTKIGEQAAQAAESLGFKLSPTQVRQVAPSAERGAIGFAEHNQELANKLASKGTGKEAQFVDDAFIKERLSSLGKDFDKVYKGKIFNIDQGAVKAIQDILSEEQAAIGPSGTSAVKSAADDIIKNFNQLATRKGAQPGTFSIEGEGLQRLRNALTEKARSTGRTNAHEIYGLVDEIDASVARNHPDVADKLNELRPKYRNSVILEDLYRSGGIHRGDISLERLGNMMRTERSSVRRSPQDIDKLGKIGKDNKIRAIWETEGRAPTEATEALKTGLGTDLMRAATIPLRTRGARVAQKNIKNIPTVPGTAPVAVGTLTRPFQQDEE